jgi:hypothetical protein
LALHFPLLFALATAIAIRDANLTSAGIDRGHVAMG